MTYVVLPGDGIGPLVIEQALRVLDASGFRKDRVTMPFGVGAYQQHGDTLPPQTHAALKEHRLALLGAGGTAHEAPEPSTILRLRRTLGLEHLVRPVWIRGQRVTLVGHAWDGLYREPERLVEGDVHHTRVLSASGARGLLERARPLATRRVTFVDKPTVFRRARALVDAAAAGIEWNDCSFELVNADAFVASFLKDPLAYDVIVAWSFVADVLSDLLAAVAGGVGIAPSMSLGQDLAVFEPIHGSAPRRALESPARVSPLGAIRAAALLVEHVGERERAARIHDLLDDDALPRTPDQGGSATTAEVGDWIVSAFRC